jgi:hypothetical protein
MVLTKPKDFPGRMEENYKKPEERWSLGVDSDVGVLITMLQCSIQNIHLRFKVFIIVTVKIIVFWDVMPCRLADRYQCLEKLAGKEE